MDELDADKKSAAENSRLLNRRLGFKLLWLVGAAFLFAFALVPLYNVMCNLTGFNGKTNTVAADAHPRLDNTRWVTVSFTSTVMPGLAWDFYPKQSSIKVHPGAIETVFFVSKNVTNEIVTGQAVPSVSPGQASLYFKKIECFCFQRQALAPGETKEMPVSFYLSPDLPKDINAVTLSYAFYNATKLKN
ncbi:MAG TPA: cytochrome c oxidase assembly protein [Methyloradius sp.]